MPRLPFAAGDPFINYKNGRKISMLTEEFILREAQALENYLKKAYRHLHAHPEIAHEERETNLFIRNELDEMGVPYFAPVANITIALLDSGLPGATVGIRCDTDALPVEEKTGVPYASQTPGKMHACGHDGHTALGLGVAKILKKHAGEWQGKVKIIFQPAEEGEGGADEVLATGLVNDVDVFFAIHLWSLWPTGTLHAAPVTVSAAVNMFKIRVVGKGGHGATPNLCADALVAGAEMVSALQTILSRRLSPMEPAVLTIGSFHAGSAGNIIAPEAELKGTIRALNEESRKLIEDTMAEMVQHIAALHHCTAEIENERISDAVQNDPRATHLARQCALKLAGAEKLGGQNTLMLGDDFSSYGRIAPYCYMQLGVADEKKGTHYAHHNGRFAIDEDTLPLGVAWLTAASVLAGEKWLDSGIDFS